MSDAGLSDMTATTERRAAPRYSVDLPVMLSLPDQAMACRMVELSAKGARLEGAKPLAIGDTLALDLPRAGRVEATVVRSTPSYVAVAFSGAVIVAQVRS